MANTYTQIHIQVVFAVQNRAQLIDPEWKEELYKYMTGIFRNYGHKVLTVNGMQDHVHVLFGMRPTQSLAELMKNVKKDSSKWINIKKIGSGRFTWQEGYGGFSYSKSELPSVISYIENQESHHKKVTFLEEYTELLKSFEVEYDQRFVFKGLK